MVHYWFLLTTILFFIIIIKTYMKFFLMFNLDEYLMYNIMLILLYDKFIMHEVLMISFLLILSYLYYQITMLILKILFITLTIFIEKVGSCIWFLYKYRLIFNLSKKSKHMNIIKNIKVIYWNKLFNYIIISKYKLMGFICNLFIYIY